MSEEMEQLNKKKKSSAFSPKGFSGGLCVLIHDVASILAVITILFVFLARLVGVSGSSMYPTLVGGSNDTNKGGDYLVLMSNFLCSSYKNGDIVVACIPKFENGKPIVKRVIATGGQKLAFEAGPTDAEGRETVLVRVDGELVDESYIKEPMLAKEIAQPGYETTVPEGCYFLMGDNRNWSKDSRYLDEIGFVDERFIVGKALWIAFPGRNTKYGDGSRNWSRIGSVYGS